MNRMVVEVLPIGTDPPGNPGQQVTGQMGHLDPGQDQIPAVVDDQVQVMAIGGHGRADEFITQIQFERC